MPATPNGPAETESPPGPVIIHMGPEELVIRHRYEVLSIANDILIGIWFVIGSFFFFSETLTFAGTCLFVIGSIEMLIRPVIRLARRVHLRRYQDPGSGSTTETGYDF